jgi:asparagine synthase (glutamine-hydrolysing)
MGFVNVATSFPRSSGSMCGIAGYVGADIGCLHAVDDAIFDAIRYRGRDAEGSWTDHRFATLFNTRLSIIDLAGGGQPMHDRGGRYVMVFNGAIYNYRELKVAYEKSGAIFRTQSDTEVILEGFILKGERVVDDLNGMFAFAIWDKFEKRLFLARDRLGKKPLFWTRIGEALVFSSTIDAFRRIEGWSDKLSDVGLTLYSFLGSFPRDMTAFAQARALPAASFAWFAVGAEAPAVTRYWVPAYGIKARGSERDFIDEYEDILADAVRIRLRSDVPLALSFSGGTDSGTIAALAKTRFNANLACYTIDHDTPEEPSEEVAIAREAARKLELSWTFIEFDYRDELLDRFRDAFQYFDQPCQQLGLVYSYGLYEEMRKHCTVVLSGNGADELFTGYIGDEALLRFDKMRRWLRHIPDWIYRRLPADSRAEWDQFRMQRNCIPDWVYADTLEHAKIYATKPETLDGCAQVGQELADECKSAGIDTMLDFVMHRALLVSAADTNYRMPDITGYAAQVEVRSPFLDHRLVEFAARLPPEHKIGRRGNELRAKFLPRKVYESLIGPEIAWAPKKGMAANLRWDLEVVRNPRFVDAFTAAYEMLDGHGISGDPFRKAYAQYKQGVESNASALPTAGTMMNGFMLGNWLGLKLGAELLCPL